jgi:hypothetical protein
LRKRATSLLKLNPAGLAENSQNLREALAKEAAAVSAALVTWAKKAGKVELAERAHLTRTTILSGRGIDAAARAEHVLEMADEHQESLQSYKITKARLTEFDDLISEYSEAVGRPRAVIQARKQVRKSLPDLFLLADEELGHMDRLLLLMDGDHEEFTSGFRDTRKMIQVPATRALSELEQANAAERAAKKELKNAHRAAAIAAQTRSTEAVLAQARAIQSSATTAREEQAAPRPEPGLQA